MAIDRRTFLIGLTGFAACPFVSGTGQERAVVRVAEGTLSGTVDRGIRIFRGVPFAKPPVGDLRFKAPQKPAAWTGTREAIRNAPAPLQGGGQGSEDCLYLNIFAPTGPGPYPVLFWIHGGGNSGGNAGGLDGRPFAEEGIIVVSAAYRLGAMGYLELGPLLGPEYDGSGVNGIRDLVRGLEWVRDNIAAFGGDPKQVTIAGQSAGAKNVTALMAAPTAKGLFARAIMQSGSGQTTHSRESAHVVTDGMLAALGIENAPEKLLTLPSGQILAGQQALETFYTYAYPFRPVLGNAFLPNQPLEMVSGDVPLLLGTTKDESRTFCPPDRAGQPIKAYEIANIDFAHIKPQEAVYRRAFPELSDYQRRVSLLTAEEYWIPSVRFAENHAQRGGRTWMYRFDHRPDANSPFSPHGAEMGYVWGRHEGWTMHQTWAAFIRGEDPDWPQYDTTRRATLIYGQGGKTSVQDDPNRKERLLWDGLL